MGVVHASRSLRVVLLGVLILACSPPAGERPAPGRGQTDAAAEFPRMSVGDQWEKNTEKGVLAYKVIGVRPDGSFTLELRNAENNSVFNQYFDNQYRLVTEINLATGATSRLTSPPAELLKFPLFVGSKWEQEFEARSSDGFPRTFRNSFAVESLERVDSKAGTFKAFKIVRTYVAKDSRNTYSIAYWYSPELKIVVKSKPLAERDAIGNPFPYTELLSYTRAQDVVQAVAGPSPATTRQGGESSRLGSVGDLGDFYALLIGNNDYRHLPKLRSAIHDISDVSRILSTQYGFKVEMLTDATRSDIISALNKLRRTLTGKDNLLIYYAGHGILDEGADEGYWLPVDAEPGVETNWIANSFVTASIRAIAAKHVIIVADSCYAGKLTRGVSLVDKPNDYLARISAKRARTVLSSGGLEPVLDSGGKNNHSVFASAFIDALTENRGAIDATQLFSSIRRPIMLNSNQTPEYSDIRNAGHDGGDFIFVRK
jgi:hypothetical protein